jgi:hypothetical protein
MLDKLEPCKSENAEATFLVLLNPASVDEINDQGNNAKTDILTALDWS